MIHPKKIMKKKETYTYNSLVRSHKDLFFIDYISTGKDIENFKFKKSTQ